MMDIQSSIKLYLAATTSCVLWRDEGKWTLRLICAELIYLIRYSEFRPDVRHNRNPQVKTSKWTLLVFTCPQLPVDQRIYLFW